MANTFDNDAFFSGYQKIRNDPSSYNELVEQPAMRALLPNLKGKSVLDLGCGAGKNCLEFLQDGASRIVGIDISKRMLDIANSSSKSENIEYVNLGMESVELLEGGFDVVYSSFAMHYVEDFQDLCKKIHSLMVPRGMLLFSQEHPLVTAPKEGAKWVRDECGLKVAVPVSDYLDDGERIARWIENDVTKYHRSFSTLTSTLVENGFSVENVVEPRPTENVLSVAPWMYDEMHRPTCIIFKAQKKT